MDDFLSTQEAAEALGISVRRVIALISSGRLKAQRLGNAHVIARADLDAVRERKPGRPAKAEAEESKPAKKAGPKKKGKAK